MGLYLNKTAARFVTICGGVAWRSSARGGEVNPRGSMAGQQGRNTWKPYSAAGVLCEVQRGSIYPVDYLLHWRGDVGPSGNRPMGEMAARMCNVTTIYFNSLNGCHGVTA